MLAILGYLLVVVGGIICLIGSIMFLIVAFKESILWGIACLIIPFAALVFLFMHWDRAGKPFLIYLAGIVPIALGAFMVPGISG